MRQSYRYMKKLTYEFVKSVFKKEGYILVSTEYYGAQQKMQTECPNRHSYFVVFSSFKNDGDRCSECSGVKKHTFEYVKGYIESERYTLISKEYKSGKQKLETICPNGHLYLLTFSRFLNNGDRCSTCRGHNKYNITNVKNIFKERGYNLLSEEYENVGQKLASVCPKGHSYETTLNNFINGRGCSECVGLKKYTLEQIKDIFDKRGEKLLSTEYINSKQKLEVLCNKGEHVYSIKLNTVLTTNTGCAQCSGNYKKTIDQVKEIVSEEGYLLISSKYENNKEKLELICPEGHKSKIRLHDFVGKGVRCTECWLEKCSRLELELLEWIKTIAPEAKKGRLPYITSKGKKKSFEVDILISNMKLAIEFNGLYWHSSKFKNREDSVVKLNRCTNIGIRLINIFEDEWLFDKENTKSKLLDILTGKEKCKILENTKELPSDIDIITDNRWEDSALYQALGLTLVQNLEPKGFYVKAQKRLSMDSPMNLFIIFDCGHKKWKKPSNLNMLGVSKI